MLRSFILSLATLAMLSLAGGAAGDSQQPAAPRELTAAASQMQDYLQTFPEPNQTDWKLYFDWEKWGPQLAQGQLPDRATLEAVASRFYGFHEGLEQPTFMRMRSQLKQFLDGATARPIEASQPALMVRLKPDFITDELNKFSRVDVEEEETGNWIAGAWVTGRARSQSNVTAELAPLGDAAAIAIRVKGSISSPRTVAQKGPFQISGSAESQLEGVAYMYIDKDVIRATEPVFSVRTESQIADVEGPPLLKRIASKAAHKKLSQGEEEGSEIIASHASARLKKELAGEVEKANVHFSPQDPYYTLLQRANLVPNLVTTGFLPGALQVGLRFSDGAAPQPPTARAMPEGSELEVAMHESLASSLAGNFLRGSDWSDEAFARTEKELTGVNSNEMLIGASPERWSLRWDWEAPLTAHITEEYLEYRLAFSQARIDGRAIDAGLQVKVRYAPINTRWGLDFRRIGEVEIAALKPDQPLAAEDAALFKKKFSSMLGETLFLDGLSPPAGGGWDEVANYAISSVRLEKGWLLIGGKQMKPRPGEGASKSTAPLAASRQ